MSEINNIIYNQYTNYENLGINYLDIIDNNSDYDNILKEIITYYNDHVNPIINFDIIFTDTKSIELIGRIIYTFITKDLPFELLPETCKYFKFTDCKDLLKLNKTDFQIGLQKYIITKISNLDNLLSQTIEISSTIKFDNVKYNYYLELLESDFDNILQFLIEPIIIGYNMEININL